MPDDSRTLCVTAPAVQHRPTCPAVRDRHLNNLVLYVKSGAHYVAHVKRHAALEHLSRDHHPALVVAQRLKRATDATDTSARAGFVKYWEAEGRAHLREEEEILLPGCAGFVDPAEPIVAKVLTDHVRIRHLADAVGSIDRPGLDVLHELGRPARAARPARGARSCSR